MLTTIGYWVCLVREVISMQDNVIPLAREVISMQKDDVLGNVIGLWATLSDNVIG